MARAEVNDGEKAGRYVPLDELAGGWKEEEG